MLGKIVGALLGARAARSARGVDQPGGAVLGMVAVTLARRFGIPGMLAAAVGGYALKRYNEKRRVPGSIGVPR